MTAPSGAISDSRAEGIGAHRAAGRSGGVRFIPRNALRFKRPTWVYVDGELRSGFALKINDAESFLLFGRVEPAIDGTASVERYAKAPSRQLVPQATETIAPQSEE